MHICTIYTCTCTMGSAEAAVSQRSNARLSSVLPIAVCDCAPEALERVGSLVVCGAEMARACARRINDCRGKKSITHICGNRSGLGIF